MSSTSTLHTLNVSQPGHVHGGTAIGIGTHHHDMVLLFQELSDWRGRLFLFPMDTWSMCVNTSNHSDYGLYYGDNLPILSYMSVLDLCKD